jgi:hypothetical protein
VKVTTALPEIKKINAGAHVKRACYTPRSQIRPVAFMPNKEPS